MTKWMISKHTERCITSFSFTFVNLSSLAKETTSTLKQTSISLPVIREEPEEQQVDLYSACSSSLTCYSSEGEPVSSGAESRTSMSEEKEGRDVTSSFVPSLHHLPQPLPAVSAPVDLVHTSKLQSEIAYLKSQLAAANQEIQNLNAELADSYDSDSLAHEAEERMAELLIEKSNWSKAQKTLADNLANVTVRRRTPPSHV
jgi:hypothetical protein